ncbi:peptidase M23 [Neobacillus notoginsengisoli]|uniref:Peptidase M23 n=1 Tax=Neobacillus notoginsengisoli TaxID=1578198 RepID=A0A417YQC9_9BACI|nr:peptidoglycan DD-metalloendopeptidase family protein [Neobacillus notoginsengisoli]RHW35993.1 peptidase M23 [Neobacillus notoginsengisoli]
MLPLQQQNNDNDKSALRKIAEQKAKKQGGKLARKLVKKGAKLAARLSKILAKKFIMALTKLLVWLVGTVGLPVIGIALGILVAIILISLAWAFLFGTGEGLTGEDKKTHEYIVQQANSTVNMNSSIERPYRVPEKLIAATIQLEVFSKNDDIKKVISTMANKLKPSFDYGSYDEWKEKQVTVCEDGKCKAGNVVRTKNMVSKLDFVEYWNGSTIFTYTPHVSDWVTKTVITYKTIQVPVQKIVVIDEEVTTKREICEQVLVPGEPRIIWINEDIFRVIPGIDTYKEVCRTVTEKSTVPKKVPTTVWEEQKIEIKTITKTRHQYFTSQKTQNTDYSKLDAILNSYSLSINDKKLVEANYLFLGGTINYTEWLQTTGGGFVVGGGFFDGNIIPGGGVPPQFMPYYRSAEKKYGVDWYVLAAIHFVETGFSTHPTMISSAGAVGHVQFMPATWVGWKYNIGGGLVSPSTDITSIPVIAAGRGYGRDANGDGKADPWDIEDAIHTAAYYLASNKYSSDPRGAIWHYNHAEWYVNKVLSNADRFKNAAVYEGGGDIPQLKPGSFMRPAVGPVSSPYGYRWGSMHYGIDIASGGKSNVPIVAAADGVVHRSYYSTSYGNVVYIKHKIGGKDYETIYAHMTNRAVAAGAQVKQGQFLGYMGTTGKSTGVHLHFEIHSPSWNAAKSAAINPALLVQF